MPRVCTICSHDQRQAIDLALVQGAAFRPTAAQYGVSDRALRRHYAACTPTTLVQAQGARDVANANDLLAEAQALHSKALELLQRAEQAGELRTALLGVREARACLELLAELEGRLSRQPAVNLLLAPEWLTVRERLLGALLPYPEARAAVGQALATSQAGAESSRECDHVTI
jgi:hypothetical protein